MVRVRVRLEGVRDLELKMKRVGQKAGGKLMAEALLAAAEPVRVEMGTRAPRRQGAEDYNPYLSENIVTEVDRKEEKGTVKVGPRGKAFWGYFVEFGTARSQAKPFARPSYDATKQAAMEAARIVLATGLGTTSI